MLLPGVRCGELFEFRVVGRCELSETM